MSERTLSWLNRNMDLLANEPSGGVHEIPNRMALVENGLDGHDAIVFCRRIGIGLCRG
jgi:hypothetical protein